MYICSLVFIATIQLKLYTRYNPET